MQIRLPMTNVESMLSKLKGLSPSEFENLTFDLVTSVGMRNPVWRTPGSDEGRDIEGEVAAIDFSGYYTLSKWYVECKRYSASLDWPTVWGKMAYADSHNADYLLVVTTANLSPQCKTEVSRWNLHKRRPSIRSWDATNIERVVLQHPHILVKYGLVDDERLIAPSFLRLARHTSKIIQAAYGTAVLADHDNVALDASSALAEMLTVRMELLELGNRYITYPFAPNQDTYEWLHVVGDMGQLQSFDRYGLRAILAVLRHVTGLRMITAEANDGKIVIPIAGGRSPNEAALDLLVHVAIWGDVELNFQDSSLTLTKRNRYEA